MFHGFLLGFGVMVDQHTRETLPDEYLCEIGRVAVEWTKAEAAIEAVIWSFLFVDDWATSPWLREQEGRALTTHINPLLRLDIMLSLARVCFAEMIPEMQEIEEIVKTGRDLYPKRNKAVHGLWSPMGKMVFRQGFRARGDVSPFYDVMTLDDVKAVAQECIAFDERIKKLLPALAERLVEQRRRNLSPAHR